MCFAPNRVYAGHSSIVHSLAFNAEGSVLVSGSADQTIAFWNVQQGTMRHRMLEKHSRHVMSFDVYTGRDRSLVCK